MNERVARFSKRGKNAVIYLITQRKMIWVGASIVICSAIVLVCLMMVAYAWLGRKTIEISFAEGWPLRFEVLSDKQPVVEAGHDDATHGLLGLRSVAKRDEPDRLVIPRESLPEGFPVSRDDAVHEIKQLWQEKQKDHHTIWRCCEIISQEISAHVSIDTTVRAADDHAKEVFMCVQMFLKALDYYAGELDGDDQGRTKDALDRFQADKGLEVDSKLGRKTWRAMYMMLFRKLPH